jgi:RNA polymerase sigma factor (sigma-70 family)
VNRNCHELEAASMLGPAVNESHASADQNRWDVATRASVFLHLNEKDAAPRELAWQVFHDRYAPLISGYARRTGASPQQADEIVQDVMFGFFSASPRFVYDPAAGRFRGYLRACVSRALKRLRDADRRGGPRTNSVDELNLVDERAEDPADLTLWDDLWERQQLTRILNDVRDHYRRKGRIETFLAFERNVMFDERAQRVADDLGISVASVHVAKMRITRRLAALRSRIAEEEG